MSKPKWIRVKSGLYRNENTDTVIKREGRTWIAYIGRFDFFTGRKIGVNPGRAFGTLREAKAYAAVLGPQPITGRGF